MVVAESSEHIDLDTSDSDNSVHEMTPSNSMRHSQVRTMQTDIPAMLGTPSPQTGVGGMQFPSEIVQAILQSAAFLTQTQQQSQSNITSTFEGDTPGWRALQSMLVRDLQGAYVRRPPLVELAPSNIAKKPKKNSKSVKDMAVAAGEDSDSQLEYPEYPNETTQQRHMRTRALGRYRERRAKNLKATRQFAGLKEHILYIDGGGRGKGKHKHWWKAALRGQCVRLDPTKDHVKHQPKPIIDSIWEALNSTWEFSGFPSMARRMFDGQVTKYLRNRRNVLLARAKKDPNNQPNDVEDLYWSKILALTKDDGYCRRSEEMAIRRQGKATGEGFEEKTMKVDDIGISSRSIVKVTSTPHKLFTYISLYSLIWDFFAFWVSYKYKNMDEITYLMENCCKKQKL